MEKGSGVPERDRAEICSGIPCQQYLQKKIIAACP